MPGVYKGHITSSSVCLTVQIFVVIWRKKEKVNSSLLYHNTVRIYHVYVQIDGNILIDSGGAQFHGLGTTFLRVSDGYRHVQRSRIVY